MKTADKSKYMVTLLLDRSSSMHGIRRETVDGINAWLDELRKSEKDMRFSLIQFDSQPAHKLNPDLSGLAPVQAQPAYGVLQANGIARKPINLHAGMFPQAPNVAAAAQPQPHLQIRRPYATHTEVMCLEKTYECVPVSSVRPFTQADFVPRGSTPLIDAAWDTIRALEIATENRPDIGVILAIQTDGQENTSIHHSWAELRELIGRKEAEGWEILFMGAGEGAAAYRQGAQMGINPDKTICYGLGREQTAAVFASTAQNAVRFAAGLSADTSYSVADRTKAGERI